MKTAKHILEHTFGYSDFRGQQEAIIETVLAGQDAMVIMPTGGGKSLCYQIPALIRDGVGIVISPLIALMKDQVDALTAQGVRAAYLNSSLSAQHAHEVEQALLQSQIDILYVAPERLLQQRCIDLLSRCKIALFAIDEAHCVARWGHDFREHYLHLHVLGGFYPGVPRIALTATADEQTRDEILASLKLEHAQRFIGGFDRPNIQYRIQQKNKARQQLLRFLESEHEGDAGIVYCLSRDKVESTALWLQEQGFEALPYHAGMNNAIRAKHQNRFLREDSIIIVATIAFGMGIDKPDVRFVVHMDMPKSIEAYYQETGRAGRDGLPSTALLFYGLEDVVRQRQMVEQSQANEMYRRQEQQRLNAMLGLCEVAACRRQPLLRYFGENLPEPCGNCDNCIAPPQTWDATEASQKVLSCVYRTGQRFGSQHIIDVLRGAANEKIKQFGHQRLSTYGIGAGVSENEWRSVIRQLTALGFLQLTQEGYGGLELSELCRPLLRGEQALELRRDQLTSKPNKTPKKVIELAEEDLPLWHALRACRKRLADHHGVPPYIIFGDATLKELVEYRPQNAQELLRINGVGDTKQEKYGPAFLEVIQNYLLQEEYGGALEEDYSL